MMDNFDYDDFDYDYDYDDSECDDSNYDVLENISDQLSNISKTLEKLLYEQQKTNLAFENAGRKISFKQEFVCRSLNEFDRTFLNDNTTLFLGFGIKDVKELINQFAASVGSGVKYVPSITDPDEFAATITLCKENDFILFNCDGITKSQELLNVITDIIADGQITINIGKKPKEKVVTLDVPKVNYVFFESTCVYVPKILRDKIDYCVWNESDKKG